MFHDYFETRNIKTIDELVEKYEMYCFSNFIDDSLNIYEKLMTHQPTLLCGVLQSRTNKPSVHDLMIVKAINTNSLFRPDEPGCNYYNVSNEILEFYKNRKDSSNG